MIKSTWFADHPLTAWVSVALASMLLVIGCPTREAAGGAELPRFTRLQAFNPHPPSFECKREADVNLPISPEAEALFQRALALDSYEISFELRDHEKIAALYARAMKLGHWKAQFNLVSLYLKGLGVPLDQEKAIQLTEGLMRKGVPAAWNDMGTYYMNGLGPIKQDPAVAYAFWQKGANMGSMAAQSRIGKKLLGHYDEPPSTAEDRLVGLQMIECAFSQGDGRAAFEWGLTLDNTNHEYARALTILHAGVRMGSNDAANYLGSAFRRGDPLVGREIDPSRAERYAALAAAFSKDPNLRFPALDKVLPLPPAPLPPWNGARQALINAAKAAISAPTPTR